MSSTASNEVNLSYVIWSHKNGDEKKKSIYLDKNFIPSLKKNAQYELSFIFKGSRRNISSIILEDITSDEQSVTVTGNTLEHLKTLKDLTYTELNGKRIKLINDGFSNLPLLKRYMVECRRYI